MNSRILKLALQANVKPSYSPVYSPRYIFEEEELVMFAQLIIGECAKIADVEDKNPAGCGYITKTKGDLIKEHFGVSK